MSREVPEGWSLKRLGEVMEFQNGFAFKPADWGSSGLPIVRIQNLNGGDDFNFYDGYVPTQFGIKSGDILFCWSGSRGTSFGPRRWKGSKGWLNQHIFRCDLRSGIDGDFAFYLLEHLTEAIEQAAHGGAGLVHIKKSELVKFEAAMPPLHEQRRIAEILSSVDDAIAATRAVIEQTRKVKQGVLERLLTKGISHTRFKQTEIGEIPEGWETRALGELAEFVNGRGFKPHEWGEVGLPIIRIQNLNGSTEFNYFDGAYHPKLLVEPGDLLFAWSGSRGTSFGPHVWSGPRGLLNYHTWRVSLQSPSDRDFLYFALLSITKKIERDSHGASALVHMQKAYIVDYLIPYPPESERMIISKILSEHDAAIEFQDTELERLISVKSALMSDLLTGRKRVTDALSLAAE